MSRENRVSLFLKNIEYVNEQVGRLVALLIPVVMVILTFEVVLRYGFNHPTIWAMETSQLLMCVFVALGGAYTALHGGHVNVDILAGRLPERKRAIIDLLTSLLFFTFVIFFLWQMGAAAIESVSVMEHSGSWFAPPIYPVKVLMAVGVLLLLFQGVSKFIKDFFKVLGKSPFPSKGGNK